VKRWILAPSLFLALALFAGCARREASENAAGACSCAENVVDPTLLAFLSKARAAHHEADLAEDGGDVRGAIAALDGLVKGVRPGGAHPRPEVAEVIADTRARLADLRSASGDFAAASADIEDGLRLAPTPTHLRGHLLEVRGVVEERRSKSLKEKGDATAAERARQDAMRAFQEAIEVNDEVISHALAPDAGK
jgi:hypothetical protein